MIYRPIGDSEVQVSIVGLGGHEYLPDGRSRGFNDAPDRATLPGVVLEGYGLAQRQALIRYCYQAGINFFADGDHIGHELSFLAALCSAEFVALTNSESEKAILLAQYQFTFLKDHLLCWLPTFVIALSLSDHSFYAALGRLTLNIAYDHWISVCQESAISSPTESQTNQLPHLSDLLQDEQTNLKQIVEFLTTPPNCGLYLGREAIEKLARSNHLPRGFGSRRQTLSNLFHSAAQYELMPDLLQDLAQVCDVWCTFYERQVKSYPEIESHIETWLQRVASTSTALSAMHESSLDRLPYSP